jgi:hypothetical protein
MEGAGIMVSRRSVAVTMYITHGPFVPREGLGVSIAVVLKFSCTAPTFGKLAVNPTDWNL